jgi:hypothetical protein
MGFSDFIDSLAFGLLVVGIFVAVFGIPIAVAYFVFSVVSSPDVNSLIRGIIFSLYTIGVFMAGVFIIGSAYESNRKDIIELIDQCEDKAASISRDVRRCSSSAESKAYDVMACLKAIEEKI